MFNTFLSVKSEGFTHDLLIIELTIEKSVWISVQSKGCLRNVSQKNLFIKTGEFFFPELYSRILLNFRVNIQFDWSRALAQLGGSEVWLGRKLLLHKTSMLRGG